MLMKSGKIKIVVTHALLLYFLCFVIPPVSSIIPSADSFAVRKDIDAIGKDNTRERMYLFDLTLWEILKRTKRSEKLATLSPLCQDDHDRQLIDQLSVIFERGQETLTFLTTRICHRTIHRIHNPAGFQFAYSGLSPPVLA